jgi:hypothetical protein
MEKVFRVSNGKARQYVEGRLLFKGNNTFSEISPKGFYVVYSYGRHFPMYAYSFGQWYRNADKYSVTTSKHQSQLSPCADHWLEYNTQELREIVGQ